MDVLVGGPRDVRATLDGDAGTRCVVACPPHPQHRGSRSDERLRAVSAALRENETDCLRIDYGPWAAGHGEVRDAVAAVAHVREELGYDRVGLFGYSFGGAAALLAATRTDVSAVSALAPATRLGGESEDDDEDEALDVVDAALTLSIPMQVVFGSRDTTVDAARVADAVRAQGGTVVELSADHFFVGQAGTVADHVAPFLAEALH